MLIPIGLLDIGFGFILSPKLFFSESDSFLHFVFEERGKVGRSLQLPGDCFQLIGAAFDDEWPVGGEITALVHFAVRNCRVEPITGEEIVDAAFFSSVLSLAGWLSRFAFAKVTGHSTVGPTFLTEHRLQRWECFDCPIEVSSDELGAG